MPKCSPNLIGYLPASKYVFLQYKSSSSTESDPWLLKVFAAGVDFVSFLNSTAFLELVGVEGSTGGWLSWKCPICWGIVKRFAPTSLPCNLTPMRGCTINRAINQHFYLCFARFFQGTHKFTVFFLSNIPQILYPPILVPLGFIDWGILHDGGKSTILWLYNTFDLMLNSDLKIWFGGNIDSMVFSILFYLEFLNILKLT